MDENLIDVRYAGGQIRKLLANGCISEIAHDCASRALNALTRVESRLLDPDWQAAADVETWIAENVPNCQPAEAWIIRRAWQTSLASVKATPTTPSPNHQRSLPMYSDVNFKTKKAFKAAVAAGEQVHLFAPGLGAPKQNGKEFVEGPHYPAPHSWYATVTVKDGVVTSVK